MHLTSTFQNNKTKTLFIWHLHSNTFLTMQVRRNLQGRAGKEPVYGQAGSLQEGRVHGGTNLERTV